MAWLCSVQVGILLPVIFAAALLKADHLFKDCDKNVDKIHIVARGYIYGFSVTIPLNNTNACIESGLSCPLEAGYKYNYSSTLKVYEQCPRIRGNIRFELIDDNRESLACIEFTGKVI